ncbi:MJ0042-type zinc finger domain-containing protein [Candidatus Thiothrix anitrata]|uniref:Zinc-ribbon domain-containing protein n=1 Tax=Candidatus Thiothrix anitrata TaxID=2823902 RepID=A0ABX7X2J6_9GAMM|nr:MJ0042-type zinc finger domain-containing protein [Candidatus Thiothrix anitrata]QTR48893.1 zinc-ribbon domain-containing protein [Candidatus Thiothrix anitrata]
MYTQCSHCKAIFRVTMKELTAAQRLLRCGECDTIFDAMKSLSTTLPEERRFAPTGNAADDRLG